MKRKQASETQNRAPDTPTRELPRWWVVFGAATLAAVIAFFPSIDGAFLFDDKHLPFSDPAAASMPAKCSVPTFFCSAASFPRTVIPPIFPPK